MIEPSGAVGERASASPPGAQVPWRWWEALAVMVVAFILSSALILLITTALPAPAALTLSLPALFVVLIVVTLGYVGLRYRRALTLLFGRRRPTLRDAAAGLGLGVASFLVINLVLGVALQSLVRLTGAELPELQAELRRLALNADTAPILFVSAVILAPIAEELFFRGMLFQSLRRRLGVPLSMVLSAVAFSLAHAEATVLATGLVAATIFPLGLFLAWILARRETLLAPMLVHGVFNLLGVLALWAGFD